MSGGAPLKITFPNFACRFRVTRKLTFTIHGIVNVNFRVTLKRHAKFGNVIFKGAPPDIEPKLQSALKSSKARLKGSAIRRGKVYSLRAVQKATQYLESRLIALDYLGSRVQL